MIFVYDAAGSAALGGACSTNSTRGVSPIANAGRWRGGEDLSNGTRGPYLPQNENWTSG